MFSDISNTNYVPIDFTPILRIRYTNYINTIMVTRPQLLEILEIFCLLKILYVKGYRKIFLLFNFNRTTFKMYKTYYK